MKKSVFLLLQLTFSCSLFATNPVGKSWENSFLSPPDLARPCVYWYWDSNNISMDGITKDLEAMHAVGIHEAFIGEVVGRYTSIGPMQGLSDDWWKCVAHAVKEAHRLGMKVGIFNSPGWSQSGGPWVKESETMRYLNFKEYSVAGGKKTVMKVIPDDPQAQVVAIQAFHTPSGNKDGLYGNVKSVRSGISEAGKLFDNDSNTAVTISKGTSSVEIDLKKAIDARHITLKPDFTTIILDCKVEALVGGKWKDIGTFLLDRAKIETSVGPNVLGDLTFSFEKFHSDKIRLTFNSRRTGRLRDIQIGSAAVPSYYVEKQLGKMFPYPDVTATSFDYPNNVEPEDASTKISANDIVSLDSYVKDGKLEWNVPDGDWTVLVTYMMPTLSINSPTTPECMGWEIDKMSKEAASRHFDAYVGKLLKMLPDSVKDGLGHVVGDSYEKGSENWTDDFRQAFIGKYGYDPVPMLPVLNGHVVGSADLSDRFMWDLRRLVADRIASEYVGGLAEKCHENGLRLWLENYGHWGFCAEFLNYGGASDEVGGEFNLEKNSRGLVEIRCAASAGHTYGKPRVSAESFTSRSYFRSLPADLRRRGDWSWTEGVNHVVFHVYMHQPDDRKPGIIAWFGTDFNRNNTWFNNGKEYFDYVSRSCALLQQGTPVTKVAYYIGEDAPSMTGFRNPELPRGYDYDFINRDILLKNAKVVDGKVVLSSGSSYDVLVLPPKKTMTPEMVNKLSQLISEGATVLGNAPQTSPSGKGYPECDQTVKDVASKIWGSIDSSLGYGRYGKGLIFDGNSSLEKVFKVLGITPDIILPEDYLYKYRKDGNTHQFFVSNQADSDRTDTIAFHVAGLQPELWNPVTGEIRDLTDYSVKDGYTRIPFKFLGGESWFFVFRDDVKKLAKKQNNATRKTLTAISGEWNVTFKPSYAQPFERKFKTLSDWSLSEDTDVRFFSGTAIYRKSFNIDKLPKSRCLIDLGTVNGIASVMLNGKDLGMVWYRPYSVDVSKALKTGENTIEIKVTNQWLNRLVGDRQPGAKPVTWTTNIMSVKADTKLLPSGLLGPVTVDTEEYEKTGKPLVAETKSVMPIYDLPETWVEGGDFTMGRNDGYHFEGPAHKVHVDGFYMATTEVTQSQWIAVMGYNPSTYRGDNLPVENVTYREALQFVEKLDSLTGRKYSLPTEAEWEYAAKKGASGNSNKVNGWYVDNSNHQTHPVATSAPNALGIYDMAGNVWEWCLDDWQVTYNMPTDASLHVYRGGGWNSTARMCESTYRFGSGVSCHPDLGFRVVRHK